MENKVLEKVFNMQKSFQEDTLGTNISSMTIEEKMKFVHEHSYFLIEEVTEMLRELPYHKSWKDYSKLTEQEIEEMVFNAREEVIDQFIFLVNVMIMLDIKPDDIMKMYEEKLDLNKKRQFDPTLGYVTKERTEAENPESKIATTRLVEFRDGEVVDVEEKKNEKDEEIILAGKQVTIPGYAYSDTINSPRVIKPFLETISEYRRGSIEEDYTLVQTIPYTILYNEDEDLIYVYERLTGGGETRLHGKKSIGIGGHMNPVEGEQDFNEILKVNSYRELSEELMFLSTRDRSFLNVNDALVDVDSLRRYSKVIISRKTDVDKVHMGLVQKVKVSNTTEVLVNETETLQGSWVSVNMLKEDMEKNPDNYETWTLELKNYI